MDRRRVAIMGGTIGAAQAALTLAELGIEVNLITPDTALGLDELGDLAVGADTETPHLWPLTLRAATHPLVTLHTGSEVRSVSGNRGRFTIRTAKRPRYVRTDICTSCGRCEDACSVKVNTLLHGERISHSAIHAPIPGVRTAPSAFYIEKNGIAPCRAACPLGINVQGFVSLLGKGKPDEALALINESAPLAGVLGRVCTHPCESNCKRGEVDSPVFIQALHRYAADHASGSPHYTLKAPSKSRRERIAIVGSGPAGLSAAWELARRGYTPTIFEAHAVVGGMLATGIPRFRLPWEVRDREVAAIQELGVNIKRGVTVGRDVSIHDLRERGYRAFFLAIGAHQNKKLNIPGEELDGVVDAVSLLFALNLGVGASVGSNVVVIGGGNSAVDSARTAKRRSKGMVRMLYRRTEEEITAVAEELEEAVREGIDIEYLTQPIEILGDGLKVTGLRCQRMKMGEVGDDGRRKPELIPGSEYELDADHVVIAIGQMPNVGLLNLLGLETEGKNRTVAVDPLTLETSVPGVFAGGDCVTGPNNVVEAMAAGLQAAESIHRYLRGRDLRKWRTLEKPEPVEVDVSERDVSHYRRARMPILPHSRRKGNFEQTRLGLPEVLAEREAARCLNCALCSECRECERVCELNAVVHGDSQETVDIPADFVIEFARAKHHGPASIVSRGAATSPPGKPGVLTVEADQDAELSEELWQASAAAMQVARELGLKVEEAAAPGPPGVVDSAGVTIGEPTGVQESRVGVILCSCGGYTNSVVDFDRLINHALLLPGVCNVETIPQACSEEGSERIRQQIADWRLGKVVLAACRCCGLDQICFSCTERRVLCQQSLLNAVSSQPDTTVEYVNIREQCAKIHRDDREGATRKAMELISAGVARAQGLIPAAQAACEIEMSVAVLGTSLGGLSAARDLASLDLSVALVTGPQSGARARRSESGPREKLTQELGELGVRANPWPDSIEITGEPGGYELELRYGSQVSCIRAGAVLLNMGDGEGEVPPIGHDPAIAKLMGYITGQLGAPDELTLGTDPAAVRAATIRETAGIFTIVSDGDTPELRILKGSAAAARTAAYLRQGVVGPRDNAVSVDAKLCRGCGECVAVCPYIQLVEREGGVAVACVDEVLCLGCGACVARCPTGALSQLSQSEADLLITLEAILRGEGETAEVG